MGAVQFDLGIAIFLTATVLILFLHSWRNVVIVLLAIPTSLISTFIIEQMVNGWKNGFGGPSDADEKRKAL